MNYLKSVEQFHITFNQTVLDQPQIPAEDRVKLRLGLIKEELRELEDAYNNKDVVEMADALADLMYVVAGTVLESGLKDKFDILFAEVHRSNMSKACESYEEAMQTIEWYGCECYIQEREIDGVKKLLVFRESDDKLLKNKNYSPANISKAIDFYESI